MVEFNPDWEADFLSIEKLPTRFLDKPPGLDGHHVGTQSNVSSHPDANVRRLLIELGTRTNENAGLFELKLAGGKGV